VPYSFLSWANKEFGNGNKSTVQRLVIETKDPTNPAIVNFLDSKGYETIREKLKSSRLNIILKFIISFLGSLGFVIILLAFMVFFLSFQLLISKSSEKIRRLKWLGYHYMEISKPYLINLALIMGIITLVCFILVFLLKQLLMRFTAEWSLEFTEGINPLVLVTGAGLIILIFVANSLSIINQTKKIY
jgi:predicted lysophospholipase L1 biosynthesis ABC-type transport system permease subunit